MSIEDMRAMGYTEGEINSYMDSIRDSGPNLVRLRKLKSAIRDAQTTIRNMEGGYNVI
jgi:hypothetical protein